jgi:hypothetical protein
MGQARRNDHPAPAEGDIVGLNHSEETHQLLVAKIPEVTGRSVDDWLTKLEDGPGILRFDDRVNWLRDEFDLAHGPATAIVHEQDLRRAQRSFD